MISFIFIFIISCTLLFFSGQLLIGSLIKIARFLGWKEFVVAFIMVALATSVPNLFVGITAALHRVPQLSFGEVVGGNLFEMTVLVALTTLVAKGLPAQSKIVQSSAIFTMACALLPLILILDGSLGRGDGLVLLSVFLFYLFWLFSKKERFCKTYEEDKKESPIKGFKSFIGSFGKILIGLSFMVLAAEGIVRSATFFAEALGFTVGLVGILIVGISNALPEAYFMTLAAKRGQTWMILGNMMGSVIIISTLVLGIVALIYPIEIVDFSPFAVARLFLITVAVFFFLFVRSDRKISIRESLILLAAYALFFLIEILIRK
ncbi:MAG: hypothetical protein PHW72_01215 [Candidatus Pacebacteria bacterium]|nr:hypothetical protein [Candidatus Paceibacterota bacterium]